MNHTMRATSQDEFGGPEVLKCLGDLAVLPAESSIPPKMTPAEWQHRKLAA